MTYNLSSKSGAMLVDVHPDLVKVVRRAIEITDQDFAVHEGVRSVERQREYVRRGVSKTMKSLHLRQADNYGHAVDLVPFIDHTLRWEWPGCYRIAAAMREAAIELNVKLVWGGVWDRPLNLLQEGAAGLKTEVEAYARRHPGPDFLDGPHYQLAA